MQPGDIIAERFEIVRPVGSGAMGVVFLARDHATGSEVAVKALRDPAGVSDPRFDREATALAGLHHPHIVRFIAHGATPLDEAYLVMEWIDGEDLGHRLMRGRLRLSPCFTLGARIAEALSEAHARGVIHRDVKPSNLFLPAGDMAKVKVLDFGIATISGMTRATQTGAVLGTPGYMPPEQARGDAVIDPRADMFSLGCVLFECLTGARAFAGQHLPAVLAKILFEPAPRARTLRPEVPEALDALISRMLAKDPAERPTSAEVAAALASFERLAAATPGPSGPPIPPVPVRLTADEQRVLSVVMIGPPRAEGTEDPAGLSTLRGIAQAHGARIERMADGSMAAIPFEALPPTDEAAQAARLSLAIHSAVPDRRLVMATGRSGHSGGMWKPTVGDSINRAVRLLDEAERAGCPVGAVLIDEASARLLEQRFEVRPDGPGFAVLGEIDPIAREETLLGRASPYVGRKAEIGILASLLDECVEESVTRAAVVVGPSGFGKSRLAQEFLRVVRREAPRAAVWPARAEPLRAGAVFGLLGQALRSAAGLRGGEPREVGRARIRALTERVPAASRGRVTEFIGEMTGVPFPDDDRPELWAARTDARLMREQMIRAFADVLRAECAARPVVMVLDDLQWADAPSIRGVARALAALKDVPFFVLGLGRPELAQTFPKLWEEQGATSFRLKELSRKAGAELVTKSLGPLSTPSLVDRLVTQADGHVLYLEELIRAVAAGHRDTAPETVLALVNARLSQLAPEARRVLRAASVFGDAAWSGGVAALLGDAEGCVGHLDSLVKDEILACSPASRFPGESEYVFRHALLREGAYAMLTDADRGLGHRLAGEWLEQHGEGDPAVLAAHFERAGDGERAGLAYARAAERSHSAGDSDAAIRYARRGLALTLPDETRSALLGVLCEAHVWRFEWDAAASLVEEALRLARPGSVAWVHAMTARLWISVGRGEFDAAPAALNVIESTNVASEAAGTWALSLAVGVFVLDMLGRFQSAGRTLAALSRLVTPTLPSDPRIHADLVHDPSLRGWFEAAGADFAAVAEEDPFRGLTLARAAAASFEAASDPRGLPIAHLCVGHCLHRLGAYEEAARTLRRAVVDHELGDYALLRDYYLGSALLDMGAHEAARDAAVVLVERSREVRVARYEGRGHHLLARLHARAGDLGAAERSIRLALDLMPEALLHRQPALVAQASIRLAQGHAASAVHLAEDAVRSADALGAFRVSPRVVLAEALAAAGDLSQARAVLGEARALILSQAERIGAPALKQCFLSRVPDHARVAELAVAWRIVEGDP